MPVPVINAKNITGSPVTLPRLGVTILGGQSYPLSDYYRIEEIMSAPDLAAAISAGQIVLNDGITDLTQAQSIAYLTIPNNPMGAGVNSPWKGPCRVATTANITLSGLQTIDGVAVAVGDRVLVKNQNTPIENGIYSASSGAWTRTVDGNETGELVTGSVVLVTEGATQSNTFWSVTTTGVIVIGTSSITFAKVSGEGESTNYGSVVALPLATTNVDGVASAAARSDHTHGLPARIFGPAFVVRLASTANVATIAGLLTIDGVATVAGDRVLLKDQAIASQNGVYIVDAGAWSYAPEFVTGAVFPQSSVRVAEGAVNANTQWNLTTTGSITVGTTAQTWEAPAAIGFNGEVPRAWLPQSGTTVTLWGMGGTTAGTVSHPALASTNFLTQMRRTRFASATGAGSFAGIRAPDTQVWRGNAAGLGGFYFACRFAMTTNLANARAFVGLYASTAALTNVDPSTLTNIVGMSLDAADTNWQLLANKQAGPPTKIDLGASFTKSTTAVFELRLRAPPNASRIDYQIVRLDSTGNVTGTLPNNTIPQSTAFLTPYIWITNNNVASSAQIEMARLYLETPQ